MNAFAPAQAAPMAATTEAVYEDDSAAGGGAPRGTGAGGASWSLEGPAGTRRLLSRALPKSPSWLSERGLDLSVQIKFQVLPGGSVKRGAVVKKTSGFPEVDREALEALKRWRFAPVRGGVETWGVVTFRFLPS
jgi:protein TonB